MIAEDKYEGTLGTARLIFGRYQRSVIKLLLKLKRISIEIEICFMYSTRCFVFVNYEGFLWFKFLGCFLFWLGFAINIHSDWILRNLRKPHETSYKIPRGSDYS